MSVLYRMVVDDVGEYVVVNDVHFAILVYMDLTFAVACEGRRTRVSMTYMSHSETPPWSRLNVAALQVGPAAARSL